jgi:hypothetical protein
MQGKERNERHQRNNDEKRPTGNPGRVCSGSARANKAAAQASLSNLININRYANRKKLPFVSTCGAMRSFKNFMLN